MIFRSYQEFFGSASSKRNIKRRKLHLDCYAETCWKLFRSARWGLLWIGKWLELCLEFLTQWNNQSWKKLLWKLFRMEVVCNNVCLWCSTKNLFSFIVYSMQLINPTHISSQTSRSYPSHAPYFMAAWSCLTKCCISCPSPRGKCVALLSSMKISWEGKLS